jgi:hypothetical protein
MAGRYVVGTTGTVRDQRYRTDVNGDAGMTRHTNGKTNNAGLTFFPVFRYSGICYTVKNGFETKFYFEKNNYSTFQRKNLISVKIKLKWIVSQDFDVEFFYIIIFRKLLSLNTGQSYFQKKISRFY